MCNQNTPEHPRIPQVIFSNCLRSWYCLSQVLGLDDNASTIKMIYSILTREKLLNLLSQGLSVSEDANEGDDKMLSLDDLKMQIQQQVAEDPFVTEQAPNVIPWRELSDPEAAFAQCTSPAEVQKIEASITERVNHSKTAIGALRRSIRDRTKIKILPFWNYKRLHIMILI